MGINFDKGGRPLILLSVDDAIMFISYGQSDQEILEFVSGPGENFEEFLKFRLIKYKSNDRFCSSIKKRKFHVKDPYYNIRSL